MSPNNRNLANANNHTNASLLNPTRFLYEFQEAICIGLITFGKKSHQRDCAVAEGSKYIETGRNEELAETVATCAARRQGIRFQLMFGSLYCARAGTRPLHTFTASSWNCGSVSANHTGSLLHAIHLQYRTAVLQLYIRTISCVLTTNASVIRANRLLNFIRMIILM